MLLCNQRFNLGKMMTILKPFSKSWSVTSMLSDHSMITSAWQNVGVPQDIGPIEGGHGAQEIFCEPYQREMDSIKAEMKGGRKKIRQPIVIVLLDASQSGKIKVALTYGVTGATWDAKYSIRINSLDNVALSKFPSPRTASTTTSRFVRSRSKPSLWTTIPKIDRRVYLKAKVKNDTELPFIAGGANVYVDGSFTTHTSIPLVHTGESFECLLGIDPAVRVTYHPRTKTITQSSTRGGETTHSFSQRITVINSRPWTLYSIKIMDNIPVRTGQGTAVVLHEPRLAESSCLLYTVPHENGNQSRCRVVARWEDAEGCRSYSNRWIGKNGKINWFCTIPSNESVELTLRWDVTGPEWEIRNLEPVDVD